MPNYGDPKYWEQRYDEQKDTTFDWLQIFNKGLKISKPLNHSQITLNLRKTRKS